MIKLTGVEALKALVDEIKRLFVQKEEGKGLSSNDYTDADKAKLKAIPENPEYENTTYEIAKTGKPGLTEENFSKAEKDKLDQVEDGAQKNVIELIQRNGLNLSPDGKAVNIEVPSSISDLVNDKGFKTEEEVIALVEEHGKLKREIVDNLPAAEGANENAIYMVKSKDGEGFAEYMLVNGSWEVLGSTGSIDLTGYVREEEIKYITESEVREMFN